MKTTFKSLTKAHEDYNSAEYAALCHELGYLAHVGFVRVRGQSISFTVGKPDEIRMLLRDVREKGYRPHPSLVAMAKR